MNDFVTIICPHCGEDFQVPCESDEGSAEFVVDCEICCRPMTVSVSVNNGGIDVRRVTPA